MQMTRQRRFVFALAVGLLLTAAGCGSGFQVAPVSGRVTLDDKPLVGANIQFQPLTTTENKGVPGPGSYAKTDNDGRFTLRLIDPDEPGAVVGQHRVNITTAQFDDQKSDAGAITGEKVPEHYRNGVLRFEVPPEGTDNADFKLLSTGG